MNRIEDYIRESVTASIRVKQQILESNEVISLVGQVSELIATSLNRGNRVIFAGNGGSAADAQHLAAEFVSRFEFDRPGLPSISLSTDTSMITAISNDYGYEKLFKRQLEAQARAGDVFVGITTSGRSKNILEALSICPSLGVKSVCLCGENGLREARCDYVIKVPSTSTARIQESHILLGHIICGHVERAIFGNISEQ